MKRGFLARMASNTVLYCVEHTDSTATQRLTVVHFSAQRKRCL